VSKKIAKYDLGWHPQNKKPYVLIHLEGGSKLALPVQTAEELAALAAILRESPVFLHDNGIIGTSDQVPEAWAHETP
jgi:hypothetical protein